eukprot:2621930-Amphidinium_carterae.2
MAWVEIRALPGELARLNAVVRQKDVGGGGPAYGRPTSVMQRHGSAACLDCPLPLAIGISLSFVVLLARTPRLESIGEMAVHFLDSET